MRTPVALLVLLCASLLAALPTGAQASSGPSSNAAMLDDPAGDLDGLMPAEAVGHIDLVHAEVLATETTLDLRVTVASLDADADSPTGWEQWLTFQYRDQTFDAVIYGQPSAEMPPEVRDRTFGDPYAVLYHMGEGGLVELGRGSAGLDVPARTYNATFPWSMVVVGDSSPTPGEPMRLVEVRTFWDPTVVSSPHMPMPVSFVGSGAQDVAAFPEGTFLSVPGAVGDLALATSLPIRSSNGEATTFHWPIEVSNLGERELDVDFALEAGDAEGQVPPGLRLAPGSNATVNVYVTVPFNHEHGTTRMFPLKASAGADQAVLKLGVDYPAIPQPAGHHPDLWLHTSIQKAQGVADAQGPQWMNTVQEDPRQNSQLLMPGQATCPIGEDIDLPQPIGPITPLFDFGSYWEVPLDPVLAMGLDGRMGETASLDLTLVGAAAAPPGTLYGRLMLASEAFDGDQPFGNHSDPFRAATPVPATPGPADLALHLDLPMPQSLDLVRPTRDDNLVLGLLLCMDAPAPAGIAPAVAVAVLGISAQAVYGIAAGGHLTLAVDEYHDVLPIAPSAAGLKLAIDEPVRRAAPGATVLFTPVLSFADDATGEHAVRLFGTGKEHASLLGPASVRGPSAVELPVSFVVPDAPAGQVFDVLLDVTHTDDPGKAVGLRLTVVVDPSETRDDAALLADVEARQGKQSPGLPVGLAIASLALLALARRRSD